ncbi:reverse transcriptase family protein [Roseovarius sp. THAF27]|uniref:reverse transcriptase family protein n=1 Tax=Roseovarius sp. THAF27 TaxID=2587850 RepID=UPI00126952D4|nr:reverse transcriptase family protein [Roseovarius sp. THAF27]
MYERYELERSPFAQKPTQRDIAALVRENKEDLNKLGTDRFKEQFLVRRTIETSGKERRLVYPEARLRAVHERLKYHLNKIIQPSYLFSPRKNRSQRDNAEVHLSAFQYLTLDIKQFYPSTTRRMIRNSLAVQFGMAGDVAGLIAHVATADDRACFGSPLTPVLASLVHRPMFDEISDLCVSYGLSHSIWVDDLTISGPKIPGAFIAEIRRIIASYGLRSHKLKYYTGNKAVFVTGVGIVGSNLVAKKKVELRSKELWRALKNAETLDEIDTATTRLLAHLGGIKQIVGKSSKRGQKLSNEMHSIRQKREKAFRKNTERLINEASGLRRLSPEEQEARREEIDALPF